MQGAPKPIIQTLHMPLAPPPHLTNPPTPSQAAAGGLPVEEILYAPQLRYLMVVLRGEGEARSAFIGLQPNSQQLGDAHTGGQLVGVIVTLQGEQAQLRASCCVCVLAVHTVHTVHTVRTAQPIALRFQQHKPCLPASPASLPPGRPCAGDQPHDFYSRFFAPWAGIAEDPVTGRQGRLGSSQQFGAFGACLVMHLGWQGNPRCCGTSALPDPCPDSDSRCPLQRPRRAGPLLGAAAGQATAEGAAVQRPRRRAAGGCEARRGAGDGGGPCRHSTEGPPLSAGAMRLAASNPSPIAISCVDQYCIMETLQVFVSSFHICRGGKTA